MNCSSCSSTNLTKVKSFPIVSPLSLNGDMVETTVIAEEYHCGNCDYHHRVVRDSDGKVVEVNEGPLITTQTAFVLSADGDDLIMDLMACDISSSQFEIEWDMLDVGCIIGLRELLESHGVICENIMECSEQLSLTTHKHGNDLDSVAKSVSDILVQAGMKYDPELTECGPDSEEWYELKSNFIIG